MDDEHLVFLSYASPDRDRVDEFYGELNAAGFNVWMDKYRLKAGQNWEFEIKRALQRAIIVVIFLSHNSIDRRGYVQKEIRIAIDNSLSKLDRDIYNPRYA